MNHRGRIEEVQGEEIIPEFKLISMISYAPTWFRPLIGSIIEKVTGEIRASSVVKSKVITENRELL